MSVDRRRPKVTAHQWWKNGDHPKDYPFRMMPNVEECEGLVVRYYRNPEDHGDRRCGRLSYIENRKCSYTMDEHGWIDNSYGGFLVCPGDWVVEDSRGEYYPIRYNPVYE